MFATAITHHIESELNKKMCRMCRSIRKGFAIYKVLFSYYLHYFICFTYYIHIGIFLFRFHITT